MEDADGDAEGDVLGLELGDADGDWVIGALVGLFDGEPGITVGVEVTGAAVNGAPEGDELTGAVEGKAVAVADGDAEGDTLGLALGEADGD